MNTIKFKMKLHCIVQDPPKHAGEYLCLYRVVNNTEVSADFECFCVDTEGKWFLPGGEEIPVSVVLVGWCNPNKQADELLDLAVSERWPMASGLQQRLEQEAQFQHFVMYRLPSEALIKMWEAGDKLEQQSTPGTRELDVHTGDGWTAGVFMPAQGGAMVHVVRAEAPHSLMIPLWKFKQLAITAYAMGNDNVHIQTVINKRRSTQQAETMGLRDPVDPASEARLQACVRSFSDAQLALIIGSFIVMSSPAVTEYRVGNGVRLVRDATGKVFVRIDSSNKAEFIEIDFFKAAAIEQRGPGLWGSIRERERAVHASLQAKPHEPELVGNI